MITPIFNSLVLGLMLNFEIKQRGFSWQGYKAVILLVLLFFQILMWINFAFAKQFYTFRVVLQTFEQGMRGICFFLVAMYFFKKSSKILNNKHRWIKITNVMILCVLIIFVTEAICGLTLGSKPISDITECRGPTNVLLQFDQVLVLGFFIVLAYYISTRISEQRKLSSELQLDGR